MNQGKSDMMLIFIQNATDNHKKNMRNTFKQMKTVEKREKKVNGEASATFIYGNIIKNYLDDFKKEKEEREKEAEKFRDLKDYLQEVSLEEGDNNKHLVNHSRKEVETIAKELGIVNAEIKEIGTLTSTKDCD